jgi:hypothetical protein
VEGLVFGAGGGVCGEEVCSKTKILSLLGSAT